MTTSRKYYSPIKRLGLCAGLGFAVLFPTMVHAENYQVRSGDTLWKLSEKFSISIDRIREENKLVTDELLIGQTLIITSPVPTETALPLVHEVKSGESLYIISQKYGITIQSLMSANGITSTMILVGQKLAIPSKSDTYTSDSYTVRSGDTLFLISERFQTTINGIKSLNSLTSDSIWVGQVLKIPTKSEAPTSPISDTKPTISYKRHTVQSGDTLWNLGIFYGLPANEIAETNGLSFTATLDIGQQLQIPVHHVPVKPVIASQYGELLDWSTEAQYVWPIGTNAKVIDMDSGLSWIMKRTYGAFHADVEPLSKEDTQIMKSVWGGEWSWTTRAVIVEVNGHRIAASASAMPHSIEQIKNNDFAGHSDIHFLNSRRHKDNKVDPDHQTMVRKAAGQQ
jgi:LysM repeat protein